MVEGDKTVYSLKDVANNLGYSEDQVRNRLDQLRTTLDEHIRRGERNKILFTSTGFQIFQRVKEMEDEGVCLKEIPKSLDKELNNNGSNVQGNGRTNLDLDLDQGELIKEKDRRIQDLQNRVRYLKNKLDERDRQIQQLLPAAEEGERNLLKDKSLWQVIREWFKQPA